MLSATTEGHPKAWPIRRLVQAGSGTTIRDVQASAIPHGRTRQALGASARVVPLLLRGSQTA